MRTALAFALGFIVATFTFAGIAYSEQLKIHWTKRERFIQYHKAQLQLVEAR